jgi:hypothetical protein
MSNQLKTKIMGTSNFFLTNANGYYVIKTEFEDEDGQIYEEDMDYKIQSIVDELEQMGYYKSDRPYHPYYRQSDCREICRKEIAIPVYKNSEIVLEYVYICIFLNYGYYSDCNLDYRLVMQEVEFDPAGLGYDLYYIHLSDLGLENSEIKQAEKIYTSYVDEICKDVDKLLKSLCDDTYVVSARFSNGETWYSKKA